MLRVLAVFAVHNHQILRAHDVCSIYLQHFSSKKLYFFLKYWFLLSLSFFLVIALSTPLTSLQCGISMWHLFCVVGLVTTKLVSLYRKNRHGHWYCCMSTGRKKKERFHEKNTHWEHVWKVQPSKGSPPTKTNKRSCKSINKKDNEKKRNKTLPVPDNIRSSRPRLQYKHKKHSIGKIAVPDEPNVKVHTCVAPPTKKM